jgi:hypothetical protein
MPFCQCGQIRCPRVLNQKYDPDLVGWRFFIEVHWAAYLGAFALLWSTIKKTRNKDVLVLGELLFTGLILVLLGLLLSIALVR